MKYSLHLKYPFQHSEADNENVQFGSNEVDNNDERLSDDNVDTIQKIQENREYSNDS